MSRRVVITGVGAVTPLGAGARTMFERWAAGGSGIVAGVAPCADFDARETLGPKLARRTDRFAQLALAASDEAIADAGWEDGAPYEAERVGCVIGTGIGGIGKIETQQDVLRDRGADRVSPLSVPLLMANAGSGMVAMRHGLKGQSFSVASACAAGAHAIGAATRMIEAGGAHGGVEGGGGGS